MPVCIDTQHDDIQYKNTQNSNPQHDDNQHNGAHQINTLCIKRLSVAMFSIMTLPFYHVSLC
jgi:hypothetical protein